MSGPDGLQDGRRGISSEDVAAISAAVTCVTVVGIGLSLSIPLLSIEMERRGASSTLIGLNTAVAGIASICTVPFVPRLAARVGVAPLLGLALLVGAISLALFPMLPASPCGSPCASSSRQRSARCSSSPSTGSTPPPRRSGAAW